MAESFEQPDVVHHFGDMTDDPARLSASAEAAEADAAMLAPARDEQDNLPAGCDPFYFKVVHYNEDGTTVSGDHPDPAIAVAVEHYRHDKAWHDRDTADRLATDVTPLTGQFSSELATVRAQLAADFGAAAGDVPAIAIAADEYDGVFGFDTAGVLALGSIMLRVDQRDIDDFGLRPFIVTAFHEGAHSSAGLENEIVSYMHAPPVHAEAPFARPGVYRAVAVSPRSFIRPVRRSYGGMEMGGSFWEEGFVESYALRRAEQMGMAVTASHTRRSTKIPLAFTTDTAAMPHYSADEHRYFLPWRYATGVTNEGGAHSRLTITESCMPAYAVDLLDEALPGLFDAMIASRSNSSLLTDIKRRINSIATGLYDDVARLPHEGEAFQEGLFYVERALGVLALPVRDLRTA